MYYFAECDIYLFSFCFIFVVVIIEAVYYFHYDPVFMCTDLKCPHKIYIATENILNPSYERFWYLKFSICKSIRHDFIYYIFLFKLISGFNFFIMLINIVVLINNFNAMNVLFRMRMNLYNIFSYIEAFKINLKNIYIYIHSIVFLHISLIVSSI